MFSLVPVHICLPEEEDRDVDKMDEGDSPGCRNNGLQRGEPPEYIMWKSLQLCHLELDVFETISITMIHQVLLFTWCICTSWFIDGYSTSSGAWCVDLP